MDPLIIITIEVIITVLAGYVIGRLGDYYVNFWMGDPGWLPDHWIYGLLLMIVGPIFFKDNIELIIFSFGTGVFVSDLRDFCRLKFFGADAKTKETRKFWHID